MLSGRFAQACEAVSIFLLIAGIAALCQPWSFALYGHALGILLAGWVGFTVWSHRRPVMPRLAEGNPQVTIDGHPPLEVTVSATTE